MAEFGSVVAEVRASLDGLDRDLAEARRRLKSFYGDASKMATTLHAGGAGGGVSPDAGFRRIESARQAAEAEQRRFMATQEAAARENTRRVQETARTFFRAQSGLSAPGGGIGGGPGSFLAPASMRGLDEASAKWLKHQQSIAQAREELGSYREQLGRLAKGALSEAADKAKQFASAAAAVGAAAVIGGVTALAAEALQVDRAYQVGKIALAETLSLTTDLVDKQGQIVSSSKQMSVNYADSAKLYQQIRAEAIKTTLTTTELMGNVEQSLGFALAGGAKLQQVVPLVAQISNLAKSLGAVGPREQGFEIRALLTGQMLPRSRIGRALGISRQDIDNAKEAGNIVGFLTERLKAGRPYLTDYANSYDGLVSTLRSKGDELLRQGTEKTFARITASLGELNKHFDEKTISAWADRLSEALTQAAERLNTLASMPVWKTLRDNLGFLFFDEGEATLRQLAEKRAARGQERTAVEMARLAVGEHRRALQAAQDAATVRGFQAADRAGFTARMSGAMISPADARAIEVQRRELERVQREETAAEDALRRAHIANELKKTTASGETFRRISRLHQQQVEAAKALNQVELANYDKMLSSMEGGTVAALNAQYHERLKAIAAEKLTEAQRVKLRLAAEQEYQTKVAQAGNDAILARQEFDAKARGDELAQVRLAAQREYDARAAIIRENGGPKAEEEATRAFGESRQAMIRKIADQEREWSEEARDLARQKFDLEQGLHRARVDMLRDEQDIQRQTAKEARDFVREQADAQRGLARAQIDQQMAQKRLFGTPEKQLPPGVFGMIRDRPGDTLTPSVLGPRGVIPAQPGMLDEQQSILQAAQRLFGGGVGGLIQQQIQNRQPNLTPQLAQAQAQAQVRSLIEAAQREGGTQEVTGRLRQMGVGVTPEFAGQLQGIETRTLNLQGRQQAADQEQQVEQVRRQKEDSDKDVSAAQRRIADLADREAKAREDYQTGLKRIQDDYKRQVVDVTQQFSKLGDATTKLTKELAASGLRLGADLRQILGAVLGMTHGSTQAHVEHALAPVTNNFNFGPGALQVKDLSAAELKRAVSDLLQREARNAAPPRR